MIEVKAKHPPTRLGKVDNDILSLEGGETIEIEQDKIQDYLDAGILIKVDSVEKENYFCTKCEHEHRAGTKIWKKHKEEKE